MLVLAGDIGGTNARLALVDHGEIVLERQYPSAQAAEVETILETFLRAAGRQPERACLGVAGPVAQDVCRVTNLPWVVDGRAIERRLGVSRCRVVNDFYAAALGVTALRPGQALPLGGDALPVATAPIAVLGAGTGLGVAFLLHNGMHYEPVPTEGGHRDFGPLDDEQDRLAAFLRRKYGRASYERVVSGPGIRDLYAFLAAEHPDQVLPTTRDAMAAEDAAAVVTRLGLQEKDALCTRAVDIFVRVLGSEAGNLALQIVARGGVYVAGGIAPRMANRMADGTFRREFDNKGRLAHVVKSIPAWLVQAPQLGLMGAAVAAQRD
ncbi:MAG: glucokinase [Deltaproteobacteria bacterium]|nr:glucokinase [Deltaproteobacteria bacterium]